MKITLRAARVNKNLSMEEAAKQIQEKIESNGITTRRVTKDVVFNWERGISYPNVVQVKAIEDVYGVSYNDLIFYPENTI